MKALLSRGRQVVVLAASFAVHPTFTWTRRCSQFTGCAVVMGALLLGFSATPWYPSVALSMGLSSTAVTPSTSEFSPTPYMTMNDSRPVTWPTCAVIDYRVNLSQAPADAMSSLHAAITTLERYTHFTFTDAGSTTDIPQQGWVSKPFQAPLIIAWATPRTSTLLGSPHELAIGSVASEGTAPQQTYVAAVVVVDSTATKSLTPGTGPGELGLLLLHELSHAVGLAHSHNPNSYMYPLFNVAPQRVQPADASHLASLDPAACPKDHVAEAPRTATVINSTH
jgi:hypothetical protein